MSREGKMIIGSVLAFGLFLVGIWLTIPRIVPQSSPSPGSGMAAVGKPPIERRLPMSSPAESSTPGFPQRTPGVSTTPSNGWIVSEGTRVHQGAGLDKTVVTTLKYGRHVQLLDVEEGWQRITFDDRQTGWVQCQFVSLQRPKDVRDDGPEEAIKTLTAFYGDIGARRLGPAYDRLSFEFKRALSFARFQEGYAATEQAEVRITRAEALGPEKFLLYADILISEPKAIRGFKGEYVAIFEQGGWKLSQANLRPADPGSLGPFSTPEASPNKPAFPDPTPVPEDEDPLR